MSEESAAAEFMGKPSEAKQADKPVESGTASGQSDYSDLLTVITNDEGRPKYKSVPDALAALQHSQLHIQRLEQEAQERGALKTKLESLEELVARLGKGDGADKAVAPKPEEQEAFLLSLLDKREQAQRQSANRATVMETLSKRFGEKTEEVLKTKAIELGISVQQLGEQAANSPKAVLAWFPEARGSTPLQSTIVPQGIHSGLEPTAAVPLGASNKEIKAALRSIREEVEKEMGLA